MAGVCPLGTSRDVQHQPMRALKSELKALGLLTIPRLHGGEQEDMQTAASCFTVVREGTHDSTSLCADLAHMAETVYTGNGCMLDHEAGFLPSSCQYTIVFSEGTDSRYLKALQA